MIIALDVISITWTEMLSFTLQSLCLAVVHSSLKMMEKAKGAHGQIILLQMEKCVLVMITHSRQKMHKEKNKSRQLK